MRKKMISVAIAMMALISVSAVAQDNVVTNVKNATEQAAEKVGDGAENTVKATKKAFKKGEGKVENFAKNAEGKVSREGKKFKEGARRDARKAGQFAKAEGDSAKCAFRKGRKAIAGTCAKDSAACKNACKRGRDGAKTGTCSRVEKAPAVTE